MMILSCGLWELFKQFSAILIFELFKVVVYFNLLLLLFLLTFLCGFIFPNLFSPCTSFCLVCAMTCLDPHQAKINLVLKFILKKKENIRKRKLKVGSTELIYAASWWSKSQIWRPKPLWPSCCPVFKAWLVKIYLFTSLYGTWPVVMKMWLIN